MTLDDNDRLRAGTLSSDPLAGCVPVETAAERAHTERLAAIDRWLAAVPADTPRDKLDAALVPVIQQLAQLPDVARLEYVKTVAARYGLTAGVVRTLIKRVRRKTPAAGLPVIPTDGRQLRDVFQDARRAVVAANARGLAAAKCTPQDPPLLFRRAGLLVRLDPQQDGATPAIVPLTDAAMYGVLARTADWVDSDDMPCPPPRSVAADCLAVLDPDIPPLESVAASPVYGQDGDLIQAAGYHPRDALWATGGVRVDPAALTVLDAKALLDEPLAGFPFVTPTDKTHAIALILLPLVRRLISGPTPLHLIEAPIPRSGKTLIAAVASILATGQRPPPRSLPRDDDETRKLITAELLMSRTLIVLDNLTEKATLDCGPLAAVLTMTEWSDRYLGESRMVTPKNHAVWVLTGNNPRLSTELVGRSIRIRIDPGTDRPEERTFAKSELLDWVAEHRQPLLAACCTLVQAWLEAGRPAPPGPPLGSFEAWSRVVGGILHHARYEGFLQDREALRETADSTGDDWRAFVAAWWGDRPVLSGSSRSMTVSELLKLCDDHSLMDAIRGDGVPRSQQTRLGRALNRALDRTFRAPIGLVRVKRHLGSHNPSYHLERTDGAAAEPPTEPHAEDRYRGSAPKDPFFQ